MWRNSWKSSCDVAGLGWTGTLTVLSELILQLDDLLPLLVYGIYLQHELVAHPQVLVRPRLIQTTVQLRPDS
jgi:hypothetical protein